MVRLRCLVLFVVSSVLAGSHAVSAQAPGASAPEIEQIEQQLVAAIAARDLTTYDRLVADDYVVVNASAPRQRRRR